MKICLLQPHYSFQADELDGCFHELCAMLDRLDDEDLDLVVLPEYSDVLADVKGKSGYYNAVNIYGDRLLEKVKHTAKRLKTMVFVNAGFQTEKGIRNTTYAIDRNGNVIGRYFKAHPAPSEVKKDTDGGHELDVSYSYEFSAPYVLEAEGLRFGFLTCYDFYFYERYPMLARQNLDIIIGCSLQRTDTHETLSIINRFLCYHTNAYLVRASVSLGEDSKVCGSSCVIAPDGTVILDLLNEVGTASCTIDPKSKYQKPAGYSGEPKAHYEYIEEGRRPWLYRNGGASVVPDDCTMPYTRICAYKGFHTAAPESSMAAFGAAIAMGAEEIAFDLWPTKDGELVCCSDAALERVSNGTGKIYEHTLDDLQSLDFGDWFSESFKGLKITLFEDVLKKFAARVIMNIHIETDFERNGRNGSYSEKLLKKIIALIHQYDCERHVYFTISDEEVIRQFQAYAPGIRICVGDQSQSPWKIVDRAIALGAEKVQFRKNDLSQKMIDQAKAHGLICNLFCEDDPGDAQKALKMGIDTIIIDHFLEIKNSFHPF